MEHMKGLNFPNFEILTHGNIFSGSYQRLNYKLKPKDGKVTVTLNWNYDVSTEQSETYDLTEDGYETAKQWIENACHDVKTAN